MGKGEKDNESMILHETNSSFSMVTSARWRFDRDLKTRLGKVAKNTSLIILYDISD